MGVVFVMFRFFYISYYPIIFPISREMVETDFTVENRSKLNFD